MEVVRAAVQHVVAGLDHHVHHGTWITAIVGPAHTLLIEFFDGVDGQQHARQSGDTSLVHRFRVVPEVIVVHAINLPVVLIGAVAILGRLDVVAWSKLQQLPVVPAIQGGSLDLTGGDNGIESALIGLKRCGGGGDLHGLNRAGNGKVNGEAGCLAHFYFHLLDALVRKASLADGDRIGTRRQVSEGEEPRIGGDCVARQASAHLVELDGGSRYHCARRVNNGTRNGATRGLGKGGGYKQHRNAQQQSANAASGAHLVPPWKAWRGSRYPAYRNRSRRRLNPAATHAGTLVHRFLNLCQAK